MKNWALVTGATAGIGKETAKALASLGYSIFITGRREERLVQVAQEIQQQFKGAQVKWATFDVSDRFEVSEFIKKHQDTLQNIEILVNNAGLALGVDKMQDANLDDWEVMIDTNIKGLLFMTRNLLPMITQHRGHIVNLGSVAGRWTYPGGGVYCATKFAVRAISEGLRMDLAGTGVRVTNIEPGMVETEFSHVRLRDSKSAEAVYAGMTPLSAQDIAETISWCVSRPAHVNVQELVIYPTDQAHVGQVVRKRYP